MELADLLAYFDRTAANLEKLERVWSRAQPFIPSSATAGTDPEYEDLQRAWIDLLAGLPRIDGWTITEPLPDIDAMGRSFIDYWEIGEPPFDLYEQAEKPARDIADYRYRLNRARRRAARERLEHLTALIDESLALVRAMADPTSRAPLVAPATHSLRAAFDEVDRLVGDTVSRIGRWSDLRRHLHFGHGQDWLDIGDLDWPSVKADVDAASRAESDPLPVPDIDLGEAASERLTGTVTTALDWPRLSDENFERLLYDLLRQIPQYKNVQWLTKTRAPDRGRDLSLDRQLDDGAGGTRTERVIVQAKHWLARSVAVSDVASVVAEVRLWDHPTVRGLVIATSGRFTSDAVGWVEAHNDSAEVPYIDLWPDNRLESMLAQHPTVAAAHGLR